MTFKLPQGVVPIALASPLLALRGRVSAGVSAPSVPATGGLWELPVGVPTPIAWYSPAYVTVDATPEVTTITNRGGGGATYDMAAVGNKLKITNSSAWNNKDVFDTTEDAEGGYISTSIPDVNTFIGISTYDGGASTFGSFDGLVSESGGFAFAMIGSSGTNALFAGGAAQLWKDGVNLPATTSPLLPMTKAAVGITVVAPTGYNVTYLWRDDFNANRYWNGLTGDMIVWQETLSDAQIIAVHAAMTAFYTA